MVISFLPRSRLQKRHIKGCSSPAKDMVFFEFARQAMRVGLEMFDFKEDQEVLMPASLCPAVLEPFINLGLKVKLYSLNRRLDWTLSDIEERITENTRAVYVIHYFGIKSSLEEVRELCDRRGIVLIEDCAFTEMVGDFSIYSVWKFHALPDGAILKFKKKNSSVNEVTLESPKRILSAKRLSKIIMKNLIVRWSLPLNIFKRFPRNYVSIQDDPPSNNFGESYPIYNMSAYAKDTFLEEDLKQCAERRRLNFNGLHKFCIDHKISPLFDKISNESIPYCFPILVDDPVALKDKMRRDGIETELSINTPFSGEDYLIEVDDDFSDIFYLADHVLSIPIHQNVGVSENKYLKNSLLKHLKGAF